MTLDLTNFNPMIKEHYAPGPVVNMAYSKNKAMGLINKRARKAAGGGRYWSQPIQHSQPGGGSIDFATAMAATNNQSAYVRFDVTRRHHYRLAKVKNEVIEATADGDVDAFEPAFDEFDKTIEAEGSYLNFRLFRDQGGSIGRMSNTSFATTIMTLDDAAGTWAVRQGDVVNLSSNIGTGGAIRVGSLTVASVQRRAGTITFTANISTGIAAAAANDYVFMAGDFGAGATDTGTVSGFADWVPDSDPGATSFYGVDRTVEPEFLGGLRVDGTGGQTVAELLVDMIVQADNIGGDPDIVFANPRALGTLTKELDGKWVIMKGQGYGGKEVDIGYRGWQVMLEGHEVTIFSERMCQVKRLWMLEMPTWTMFSAGVAPMFLQKRAGSIIKVSENADAYEARVGEYWGIACKAPGHNVNGQLA